MLKKFLSKALLLVGIEFDPYVVVQAESESRDEHGCLVIDMPVVEADAKPKRKKSTAKKSGAKKQPTRKTTRKKSLAKPKGRKKP